MNFKRALEYFAFGLRCQNHSNRFLQRLYIYIYFLIFIYTFKKRKSSVCHCYSPAELRSLLQPEQLFLNRCDAVEPRRTHVECSNIALSAAEGPSEGDIKATAKYSRQQLPFSLPPKEFKSNKDQTQHSKIGRDTNGDPDLVP